MSIISSNTTINTVFGERVSVEPTPLIQIGNQYGQDPATREDLETFAASGGTVDSLNNLFRCQSGTSVGGYGVIRSKEVGIYRPGQGIEARFTARFSTGIALSLQMAGMQSLTESAAFGYDGVDFGIIHEYDGKAEVQRLTMTAVPAGAETATITLDGDAFTANLTATTLATNARQIADAAKADGTINTKWRIEQKDDEVVFIAQTVGDKIGTMSFSSSTATATITEDAAGQAKTSGNIAQSNWNISTSPFPSFDPTQLNVYRIEYGYLGAVSPIFSIYNPHTSLFVPVHRIEWANTHTTPVFGNPDMKIGWTSASLGSSGTNLTVTGASAYVAVGGKSKFRNQSFSDSNSVASVGTTSVPLISLKNRIVFGNRFNLGAIELLEVSVDNDHTKASTIDVLINTTLGGVPNFLPTEELDSIALVDKASTSVTGGKKVASFQVAAGSERAIDLTKLFLSLSPEDIITISGRTTSATATALNCSITWIEKK